MSDKIKIEEIAQPILETLQELESVMAENSISEIPKVHLIRPAYNQPVIVGDKELSEEDLACLEGYLQDEIEKMIHPTVLH